MGVKGEKARERVHADKAAEQQRRIAEVVELIIAGASISDVGRTLKLTYEQAARVVEKARARITAETDTSIERLREVELRRCDALQVRLWTRLNETDDPKRGTSRPGHGQAARITDTLLKVMDQRAKYRPGLQARASLELTGPDGTALTIPVVAGTELLDAFTRAAQAQEKADELRAAIEAPDEQAPEGDALDEAAE